MCLSRNPSFCAAAKFFTAVSGCLLIFITAYPLLAGRGAAQEQAKEIVEYENARPGVSYVGDEACRECHELQYSTFKRTGMGRSLSIPGPGNWPEFTKPVTLVSKKLGRTYTVSVSGGKMYHTESGTGVDGKPAYSERNEIAYTVGSGDVGRSYLVLKGDALFVSPISYYSKIRGWDLSPGYEAGQFVSFTRPAWHLCVTCHSGRPRPISGTRNRYELPPFRFLSVGCERCHGPGELHVRERRANAPRTSPIDPSIVNPARLSVSVRDDVCKQCHLIGDAQVLRPGKTYLDFRPGTPLDNVVSIFTAPVMDKGNAIKALSHPEQLEMSQCYQQSVGRLSCIKCHDPHIQLHGAQAVAYFREKCLTCHDLKSCGLAETKRRATDPPDDCLQCHMPKRFVSNIGHSALTDHRILKTPSEVPRTGAFAGVSADDLIYQTKPFRQAGAKPDLRTLALAYFEASQVYPQFRQRGFELLERAAQEFPKDGEIQATYGLVLTLARPDAMQEASQALQRAIDSGSGSAEVQTHLAKLRFKGGDAGSAVRLYNEAIRIDPYYTPAYLGLAYLYTATGDRRGAIETLEKILKYDPGNETALTAITDAKSRTGD